MTFALSAVVLLIALHERRPNALIAALGACVGGPLAWNAILHRTHPARFFVDIPFAPFPVSWQDTGSGVFTLALAALALGIVLRREPAAEVVKLATTVAIVAFLVDIYLY